MLGVASQRCSTLSSTLIEYMPTSEIIKDTVCFLQLVVLFSGRMYESFFFQDDDGDSPLHNTVYRMKYTVIMNGSPDWFDTFINSCRVHLNIQNKKGLSVGHVAVGFGNLKYYFSISTINHFYFTFLPFSEWFNIFWIWRTLLISF